MTFRLSARRAHCHIEDSQYLTNTHAIFGRVDRLPGDFTLQGVEGKLYALADVRGSKGTLVVFICNHWLRRPRLTYDCPGRGCDRRTDAEGRLDHHNAPVCLHAHQFCRQDRHRPRRRSDHAVGAYTLTPTQSTMSDNYRVSVRLPAVLRVAFKVDAGPVRSCFLRLSR